MPATAEIGVIERLSWRIEAGLGGFLAILIGLIFLLTGIIGQLMVLSDGADWHVSTQRISGMVLDCSDRCNSLLGDSRIEYSVGGRRMVTTVTSRFPLLSLRPRPGSDIPVEYDLSLPGHVRTVPVDSGWRHLFVSVILAYVLTFLGIKAVQNFVAVRRLRGSGGTVSS